MMTAKIEQLIEGPDAAELVRDTIATILYVEQSRQQELANAEAKEIRLWALRVFTERSNPWAEFQNAPEQLDGIPIVNVAFDRATYDASRSNTVERQTTVGVYHIDCYGYGVSQYDGAGHLAGDSVASFEALRAARLARRILMADFYTYLGLRGLVWKRFPLDLQQFQPQDDRRPVEHVMGARLSLEVTFNEFSPQTAGQIIEMISAQVTRTGTGELISQADFPQT